MHLFVPLPGFYWTLAGTIDHSISYNNVLFEFFLLSMLQVALTGDRREVDILKSIKIVATYFIPIQGKEYASIQHRLSIA